MRKILYMLIMAALALPAFGQGVVWGVVTDSSTRQAIEFVNVGIVGSAAGCATDVQGRYSLPVATADSVTLRFSHTGYAVRECRIALRGGERRQLDVALPPSARQLDALEVRDEKSRQSAFTQIDVGRLENAVGPNNGVESLVKMLPDVSSNNELSSQYSVRGGSFDENLVYINKVELFRPMLIRSGQQEGMSIVNPDLVDHIQFSPGGFDATYGDKLSSVLDITYSRPRETRGRISGSLLGFTASVQGNAAERLSYAVAVRQHSNRYLMGSMDVQGRYTTHYTDLQAVLGYRISEQLEVGLLSVATRNVYGLVPESQTTTFGGFFQPLLLRVYFDGQEQDRYNTWLEAATFNYRPSDDWHVEGHLAVQHVNESERYDIQSQYFLYELGLGEQQGDTVMFDRGVGTFLEHARNRLTTNIYSAEARVTRQARLGSWVAGLNLQLDQIDDHLREWKWVDSAGFTLPNVHVEPGDSLGMPHAPILQRYVNAENGMLKWHAGAFAQRELHFVTRRKAEVSVLLGLRGQIYRTRVAADGVWAADPVKALASPRMSVNYKPDWRHDMLFRIAAGIYQQPPFYREFRAEDGQLRSGVEPQKSYQAMGTFDWNFRMWDKPFRLTADLYYKYITDLVPYTVDNLRITYRPDEQAVAYATGLSVRLNGEIVEDMESWVSLSLMRTQEDVLGDGLGWIARPTDQRLSFKMFMQDRIPSFPWWKMSLSLIVGTGMPVTIPMAKPSEVVYRLPTYYRVDWGNTVSLTQVAGLKKMPIFRKVKDVELGMEVFNLFNFRNVVSYLWVSDYTNMYYPVPNYLTARQVNVKLTILF